MDNMTHKITKNTNKTNKSRFLMILILGLLMLTTLSTAVMATDTLTTYITDAARIKISMISQDPDPSEPGGLSEVRWKVENLGSSNAKDVKVKLVPEYPFSLLPGDDGIRDLGSIQGRQLDEEGVIVLYKLRVDEYAIEGDTDVRLFFQYDYNPWMKTDDVYTIHVRTIDAAISVESVDTDPEKIVPGNPARVDITIKNLADSYMQDITVKLDLTFSQYASQLATVSAATYFDALPFAPLKSTTEKRIGRIAPGKSAVVSYDLMTYPDAASRIYKVPITITYYDEIKTQYTKNDIIGLVVGDVPDIDIVLESSEVHSAGEAGTVTIKFVNKGITDIKFLNVELMDNGDYEITSAASDYVGNVDSDDYETAEFTVYLQDSAKDIVKIPIKITYKDANNNDYSEESVLELKLLSPEQRGEKKSSSIGFVITILIILVVAWLIYKRWEKKKKAKAQHK